MQWTDHCKASDTVAMWRNQRKARQDKRRKLAVNPAKRGTILSRVAMPVAVDVSDDEAVVFVGGHRNNNGSGGGGNNEGEKENQNQNDGVQTNNNNDNDNDKEDDKDDDDKDDDDDIEASMDLFESTQWYKGNIINNTNTNDVTTTDDGKNKALAGSSKDSSLRETHVNGGPEPYDDGLVSVLSEGSSLTMDDLADALDTAASKRRPLLLDQYSSKFFGTSAK